MCAAGPSCLYLKWLRTEYAQYANEMHFLDIASNNMMQRILFYFNFLRSMEGNTITFLADLHAMYPGIRICSLQWIFFDAFVFVVRCCCAKRIMLIIMKICFFGRCKEAGICWVKSDLNAILCCYCCCCCCC